jgi:hypothetical protein
MCAHPVLPANQLPCDCKVRAEAEHVPQPSGLALHAGVTVSALATLGRLRVCAAALVHRWHFSAMVVAML